MEDTCRNVFLQAEIPLILSGLMVLLVSVALWQIKDKIFQLFFFCFNIKHICFSNLVAAHADFHTDLLTINNPKSAEGLTADWC